MGEVGAEVAPGGVCSFDQEDFLFVAPAFELPSRAMALRITFRGRCARNDGKAERGSSTARQHARSLPFYMCMPRKKRPYRRSAVLYSQCGSLDCSSSHKLPPHTIAARQTGGCGTLLRTSSSALPGSFRSLWMPREQAPTQNSRWWFGLQPMKRTAIFLNPLSGAGNRAKWRGTGAR